MHDAPPSPSSDGSAFESRFETRVRARSSDLSIRSLPVGNMPRERDHRPSDLYPHRMEPVLSQEDPELGSQDGSEPSPAVFVQRAIRPPRTVFHLGFGGKIVYSVNSRVLKVEQIEVDDEFKAGDFSPLLNSPTAIANPDRVADDLDQRARPKACEDGTLTGSTQLLWQVIAASIRLVFLIQIAFAP